MREGWDVGVWESVGFYMGFFLWQMIHRVRHSPMMGELGRLGALPGLWFLFNRLIVDSEKDDTTVSNLWALVQLGEQLT